MASPQPKSSQSVQPVQPIAALLFRDDEQLKEALTQLTQKLSVKVDFQGPPHPFDYTSYYTPEMGEGLQRVLVSFAPVREPGFLVEAKWIAHEIEERLSVQGNRVVNIDMGYLDMFKLVLASFKERGNKIYLDREVWADMTLTFERGEFHPLPWSFPDFKSGDYNAELMEIRHRFKTALAENKTEKSMDE